MPGNHRVAEFTGQIAAIEPVDLIADGVAVGVAARRSHRARRGDADPDDADIQIDAGNPQAQRRVLRKERRTLIGPWGHGRRRMRGSGWRDMRRARGRRMEPHAPQDANADGDQPGVIMRMVLFPLIPQSKYRVLN